MVEFTQTGFIIYSISVATFGLGLGYKLGLKNTVTSSDTFCDTPKEYKESRIVSVKKTLINGKCKDVSCVFIQKNNTCKFTTNKCKLIK